MTSVGKFARAFTLAAIVAAFTISSASSSPFVFQGLGNWGIEIDVTAGGPHPGSLSINTPSGVQGEVGNYQWTLYNNTWVETTRVPLPGPAYAGYEQFDVEGLFFKADSTNAYFAVLNSTPQTGVTWPAWYGGSSFGPGDLRVKIASDTYGIGTRETDNLPWDTSNSNSKMHRVHDGFTTKNPTARNASTAGMVVHNPDWWWTNNPGNQTENKNAFFDAATGTFIGMAQYASHVIPISDGGYPNFIYEVVVPWSMLGIADINALSSLTLSAFWQPDCGNDGVNAIFMVEIPVDPSSPVPEPATMILSGLGLAAVVRSRRTRKSS